jgi:phenylpyruvate tautomerase PptA (4-oxalocrotonate tautomerase family)
MPVAKIYVPKGVLSPEQARTIVKGIHAVINDVEKRPANAQTYVLIQEIPNTGAMQEMSASANDHSESSSTMIGKAAT